MAWRMIDAETEVVPPLDCAYCFKVAMEDHSLHFDFVF